MKNFKNILLFIFLIASIQISAIIWNNLNIPLYNQEQIIGFYSIENFNPLNDVLGYLIFIFLPIVIYYFWLNFVEKKNYLNIIESIKFKEEKFFFHKVKKSFFIFIIFFLFFEFLSIDFLNYKLDFFHEGQRLSAAFNSKINDNLWSGSYITVGLFYEIIGPKLIWKVFGNESIGLLRVLDLFLILLCKITLTILSYQISKNTSLNYLFKNLFFVTLSLFSISLINYSQSQSLLEFRDLPILLTLVFFFCLINNWNKNYLYLIFIGLLFSSTYLWSIDRALVQNFLTLFIIIYLLINSKVKEVIIIFLSIIISFFLIFLFLENEFSHFIDNTISVFKEASLYNGIIHPIPFGSGALKIDYLNINSEPLNSTRATKIIFSILFTLIISVNILIFSKKIDYRTKIFLLTISLLSFLSYIYALGRTDYNHLKQVFGYPLIFFLIYIFRLLVNFFNIERKSLFISNFSWQKYLIYFTIFLFFIINLNFNNILSFKKRFKNFVNLDDSYFLDEEDIRFLEFSKKNLNSEKCVSLFSNDVALLYLIKKPSCTKFYYTYVIGSLSNQNNFMNGLKKANYILVGGNIDETITMHNWTVPLNTKYPKVLKYLNQNFETYNIINNRKILIRKTEK